MEKVCSYMFESYTWVARVIKPFQQTGNWVVSILISLVVDVMSSSCIINDLKLTYISYSFQAGQISGCNVHTTKSLWRSITTEGNCQNDRRCNRSKCVIVMASYVVFLDQNRRKILYLEIQGWFSQFFILMLWWEYKLVQIQMVEGQRIVNLYVEMSW